MEDFTEAPTSGIIFIQIKVAEGLRDMSIASPYKKKYLISWIIWEKYYKDAKVISCFPFKLSDGVEAVCGLDWFPFFEL